MKKSRSYSVIYMFIITFVAGGVVSGIYAANSQRIALNEQIKLDRVILTVMDIDFDPQARAEDILRLFEQRVKKEKINDLTYYRGLEKDGASLVGYAFPIQGAGLWGPIYGMMGVDPELNQILGVAFYRHSETPGLGGRITENWFVDQFKGLKLEPHHKSQRYVTIIRPGKAKKDQEVDGITGATITSNSVDRFMNKDIREYLPALKKAKGKEVSSARRKNTSDG